MAKRSTDAKIIQNDDETVDVTLPDSSVEEEVFSSSSPTAAEVDNETPLSQEGSEAKPPSVPGELTTDKAAPTVEEDEEDEELSRVSEGVKKRINKLTRKMREAERREKAALDYAKGLQKQNKDAAAQAQATGNVYLEEYENRLKLEESNLKTALHKAIETGDVDSQMEVQKRIAQHAMDSEKLAHSKQYSAQQQQAPVQDPTVQQGQPPEFAAAPPDPKADD
tara:strand:+ start:3960 stop:4628 length:669 start_codon:yes stop_codon:yes gene_type:complete